MSVLTLTEDLDELQASVLRTLASATRLRIIHALSTGPSEVHDLADALGLTQSATSQHLAAMRGAGIVEAARDGRILQYRLSDADLVIACDLLREVLLRRLTMLGDLAASADAAARLEREPVGASR
jgi:DNA-binding transcriptional ArsR family regulator